MFGASRLGPFEASLGTIYFKADQVHQFQQPESDAVLALGTEPIPAGPYYRDDYFDLEREAIFRRTWLNIGHISELPEAGSFIVRPLEFANASILITRDKDGIIRAFHNVCTHRGTQLTEETSGKRSLFTCRYHSWTFSNSGELRSAPDFERFYVEKKDCALRKVSVDSCAGLIFVNLDPKPAQSLRDYLGALGEQLKTLPVASATTFCEYVYEIDANWKLTYDNFQENYHLRFIHPRSGGGGAVGPENQFGYPIRYDFYGEHRTQTIWTNPAPQLSATQKLAFGRLVPALMQKGLMNNAHGRDYFALFPNFFLLGTPTQHFAHYVLPINARKSRGVVRIYWVGDDANASERFGREFSMAMARDVHSEDRAVIEAGQRGLNSGALAHIHLQSQEVLIRHLMHHVNAKVQAYLTERARAGRA
jgi:phenylpropionate dioxygenase-like ring-hydroxylating dioxygenase large terminal subunit